MLTASTFYFVPAEGTGWSLSLERFSEELKRRWPGAVATEEEFPDRRRYSDFWNDDPRHDGLYGEDETLILKNSTPSEAAPFAAWFRGLLPGGARIRFSSDQAAEKGLGTTDWWLPRDSSIRLVPLLESHVREVYGPDAP